MKYYIYIIVAAIFFAGCATKKKNAKSELVLFCAASLTDVISEITSDFEKKNNVEVKINFASSGTLARQIEHGATPVIFISANKKWLDYLNKLSFTIPETEKEIAGNSMVLIAPGSSSLEPVAYSSEMNLPELFEGRLSVGDPNHVPAGSYALQLLKSLGCEEELEPRFLPAKDVRSALMVVEMGEVEAGIVYKTDALKSGKVKIITEFPDSLHEPVNYYMTEIKGQKTDLSDNLYKFISSEEVLSVWGKYGFTH
ncbi:molybdate ABC transporter substrate-binding protein [Maribellus comscasis]|uniref:Molybdate ABC transporter substrate-binding protein n=1 Tax=Maribellus comscasis TaxID=2681766 RepID=A0A6I6JUX1_9BACT|nr:molybdate ABC transporter substrate-binding protein [Maribellus comscasis]QGY45069.1 molybdate ABC transporter substrate-binding protein [Maribellus comscasis]